MMNPMRNMENSLPNLHNYLLFEISNYLVIHDYITLSQSCRQIYDSLRRENNGQNQLKFLIQREMGIISDFHLETKMYQQTSEESFYESLDNCISTYEKVLKHWRPRLQRLFGFRTTGGVDHNALQYSVSNMFIPFGTNCYCSDISPNIDVTAVYVKEDIVTELSQLQTLFRFFFNVELRKMKQEWTPRIVMQTAYTSYFKFQHINESYISHFYQRLVNNPPHYKQLVKMVENLTGTLSEELREKEINKRAQDFHE